MNELVKEWIRKAEGDFNSSLCEYRARKFPNYDSAYFHAQQCIEKYMKGFLQKKNIPFYKTHDLLTLLELCLPHFSVLEFHKESLALLNQFSISFRYPDNFENKQQASQAIKAMKLVKTILIEKLGVE